MTFVAKLTTCIGGSVQREFAEERPRQSDLSCRLY